MKADPHPEFTRALLDAADEAKRKVGYNAPAYRKMLHELRGYETAINLSQRSKPSVGYANLYERSGLEYTVEAIMLQPSWWPIFTDEELLLSYHRLQEYRYQFPANSWRPGAQRQSSRLSPSETLKAADCVEPPMRIKTTVYRVVRDTEIAREVKRLHNWECQLCKYTILMPDGTRYAEAHHLRPLGGDHKGHDVPDNIMCVCPNHHAQLDMGTIALAPEVIKISRGHTIGPAYVKYHNEHIVRR